MSNILPGSFVLVIGTWDELDNDGVGMSDNLDSLTGNVYKVNRVDSHRLFFDDNNGMVVTISAKLCQLVQDHVFCGRRAGRRAILRV